MSLQSDLDAYKAGWTERASEQTAALITHDNASLQGLTNRALRAGAMFPTLALPNQRRGITDLAKLMDDGPLVVTFYRGGWCPYCNIELRAYQNALAAIIAHGGRLVAISPETPDNTLSTAEKNALAFDVLSDTDGRLADALGIRFTLSPAIKALYQNFGHDLPTRNGDGQWSLPMPATYVVAKGGRISLAHVDADYRVRLEPDAALAALRQLGLVTA
jgi:peroxiredoxin